MQLAVPVHAEASRQQHHVRIGAKHRSRRAWAGDFATNGGIEALHPVGVGQVVAHRPVNANQRVIIAGQPSIVLRNQFVEERRTLLRRSARHIRPGFLRARRARVDCLAIANLKVASEKIDDVRIGFQPIGRDRLLHLQGGRRIQLRHSQIKAAQRRVAEEGVNEFQRLLFGCGQPVFGAVQHRHLRWLVVVNERPIGAQSLLEDGHWKSGIDRQKGLGGVQCLQHHFGSTAAAHAVAEHLQQVGGLRGLALLNLDDLVGSGNFFQLARLRQIAEHQL